MKERGSPAGKSILMGCTHSYNSALQVGSQHLARCFAADGWQVHYLSAPVTLFHLCRIKSAEVRERFAHSQKFNRSASGRSIRFCSPFALLAPDSRTLLRSRFVNSHWWKTAFPGVESVLSGVVPDVLYLDNLSYSFLPDLFPKATCVFRVMDIHDAFPGWTSEIRDVAKTIAIRSDLTVYSAKGLRKYVEELKASKAVYIPNGVDSAFFRPSQETSPEVSEPSVLYTGMVDSRFDFKALIYAAEALNDVEFKIVGPVDSSIRVPSLPDNVRMYGRMDHADLPSVMHGASVGFIPFDVKNRIDLVNGIRPLKLFEYLASGLPVVSADWPELRAIQSPALIYRDYDMMVLMIKQALKTGRCKEGMRFAEISDWKHSFNMLKDVLYDHWGLQTKKI